jgi:hypothetical protein
MDRMRRILPIPGKTLRWARAALQGRERLSRRGAVITFLEIVWGEVTAVIKTSDIPPSSIAFS